MKKYDVIVVGTGFAGSVIAREFADINKQVLVIEKRNHIGGNMYEEESNNGIRVHKYGPHIFHTNDQIALNYIKKYSDFYFYEHKVVGLIDGVLVPIPFNFKSLELLFDNKECNKIKSKLLKYFPEQTKVLFLLIFNTLFALVLNSISIFLLFKIFLNNSVYPCFGIN
jgi:UDP-galactopyranose mutase